MRNDIETAALEFKSHRQMKKQIQEKHSERYKRDVQSIADKWASEKEAGASWDRLNEISAQYNKALDSFKASIEGEIRSAYTDQYHNWYKSNAHNYGMEYKFVPAKKKVSKSTAERAMSFMDYINKSDDIVLDAEMNKDIEQLTNDIMGEFQKSFTFGEVIEKFNPYHGPDGRFTGPGAATSFTYKPGQGKMYDNAIAREKERTKAMAAAAVPGNKKLNLDQDAIRRADDNSLMGTAGTVRAKEAKRRVDEFKEEFKEKSEWTDEQKAYVKQRQDEYTDLVSEYYNDQIRRTGDNVSWAVAGPANSNYARHDKKLNAQMNRANEYEQKLQNFKDNTYKNLERMTPADQQISRWRQGKWNNGETISSDDPLATQKLQAKLDYMNESQQKMKAANAYYRSNKTMTGFEGFSETTNARINSAMQDGRMTNPFASYQLTNNNAQIKSTQSRLTQMQSQKTKAAASGGSTSFKGGSMVRNTEANRLQLKFDSIPDAATRQQLKSSGWRWSPKNGVWQRQLTNNAEYSAQRIIESLNQG